MDNKKEILEEEEVSGVSATEELEKELQIANAKIESMEETIKKNEQDLNQVINDLKNSQLRYDRLFKLFANTLDFYLEGK